MFPFIHRDHVDNVISHSMSWSGSLDLRMKPVQYGQVKHLKALIQQFLVVFVQPALQGLLKPGGLNFNMQQTAARTREGLAKMAGILPGKLGGGSSSGDGAAGGGTGYGR